MRSRRDKMLLRTTGFADHSAHRSARPAFESRPWTDVSRAKRACTNETVLANGRCSSAGFNPKFFRYPFGKSSCATLDLVHSMGCRIVSWHVHSCDWAFNATGSLSQREADSCEVSPGNVGDYVGHVVLSVQLHKSGIVLMHEI